MKKLFSVIFFIFPFFIFCGAFDGAPSSKTVGLGIIIGEPTGLSGRIAVDKDQVVDFALSYSLRDDDHHDDNDDWHYHVHADYLFKFYEVIGLKKGELPLYTGAGVRITERDHYPHDKRHEDETHLGIRVPGGIQYEFENAPFEIFLEVAIIMDIFPHTDLDLNAGLGVRFCF